MAITSRSEFVTEILATLGLKAEEVCSLDIRMRPGEAVTASALIYVPGTIIATLKRFEMSATPIAPAGVDSSLPDKSDRRS